MFYVGSSCMSTQRAEFMRASGVDMAPCQSRRLCGPHSGFEDVLMVAWGEAAPWAPWVSPDCSERTRKRNVVGRARELLESRTGRGALGRPSTPALVGVA